MPYDAVIFDLDGTLLDTERLAFEAARRASSRFGPPMTETFFRTLIGGDMASTNARLAAEYGAHRMAEFDAAWDEEHDNLLVAGMPLKPTVHALLDLIEGMGLPLAVATSSGRASADRKLLAADLTHRFTTVVTRNCVTRPKPDPEPYLTAAARLSVAPERCLAFEDSTPGARAARAAGMTVVVVPDIALVEDGHAHHTAADLLSGARMAGLG